MVRRIRFLPLILILVVTMVLGGWFSVGRLDRALQAQAASRYEEIELFTDVLTIIRRSYVEEVSVKDLVYGAIEGMLSSLDPHSAFLPPEMYKELKVETRGEFGGLGIEITLQDGLLTVVAPIEDTPADRAGLQAGDQILKIEGRFTKDLSIMEAVQLMRGPEGTEITITVMRDAFDKPREFTLTREIIRVQSVKSRTLVDGYGYVRLVQFQEHTAEDLGKALGSLRKENGGSLQGLVLDLRNNPGGLLDQAVQVADLFLEKGLIVYTDGREEGSRMEFSARPAGTEPDYPMVILINGGSASASEIVAGALRDQQRGVLLGTPTFGKGSVQTIVPLSDDSGLRLTTARYFTPNGTSIQARGIIPDILAHQGEIVESGDGRHFREKDLKNHFESQGTSEEKKESADPLTYTLSDKDREDLQLIRALDLLKGWQILNSLQGRPAA